LHFFDYATFQKIPNCIYKIALTILLGVGVYFLGEGIVRIPFLRNSSSYLHIPWIFGDIAEKLKNFQDGIEAILSSFLGSRYTSQLEFCVCGPIIEELSHRLVFHELILKQGMKLCFKKYFDTNHTIARIFRVTVSAMVFAAQHTWAFNKTSIIINPYGAASLVWLVVLGLFLGTAQELTGNIAYPIGIHVINNTLTHYFS